MASQTRAGGLYLAALLAAIMAGAGCQQESTEQTQFDEDLLGLDAGWEAEPTASGLASDAPPTVLPVGLIVGQEYPLFKSVRQTLTQSSRDVLDTIQTLRESWITVVVEGFVDGEKRFAVNYRRIRYSHESSGELAAYDSDIRNGTEPPAGLSPYLSLLNGSFRFRVGRTGLVTEVTGIPASLGAERLTGTAAAEFVEDRIGLLSLDLGSGATSPVVHTRRMTTPVPLTISTRYTLEESIGDTRTVKFHGQVIPGPASPPIRLAGTATTVTVTRGHTLGEVVIAGPAGIPTLAHWNRHLNLRLLTDDDRIIDQQKHELVTIRKGNGDVPPVSYPAGTARVLPSLSPVPASGLLQPTAPPVLRPTAR